MYEGGPGATITVQLAPLDPFLPGATYVYPVGANIRAIAVGELNGVGKPDIAYCDDASTMTVRLGNGDGSFGAPVLHGDIGFSGGSLAMGDVNGDGTLDVIVAAASIARVFRNHGDATFDPPSLHAVGAYVDDIVAKDMNQDGKTDLVVDAQHGGRVEVLVNPGDGAFAGPDIYPMTSRPRAVAAGDIDLDGKPDLVVANETTKDLRLLRNQGDGTFAAPTTLVTHDNALAAVTTADMNGDGRLDLAAVSDKVGGTMNVWLDQGDGTFGAPKVDLLMNSGAIRRLLSVDMNGDGLVDIVTPEGVFINEGGGNLDRVNALDAQDVAVADLNGDGKPDVATAKDPEVRIYMNDGTGKQTFTTSLVMGDETKSIAAADLNGDGHADLVVTTQEAMVLQVLLNQGDGTFGAPVPYGVSLRWGFGEQTLVTLFDLNGDGAADAVFENGPVLFGKGDGTFAEQVVYRSGRLYGLAIADFDGNGLPDIAGAIPGAGTGAVFVMRSACLPSP
jgi:hypothetical protein